MTKRLHQEGGNRWHMPTPDSFWGANIILMGRDMDRADMREHIRSFLKTTKGMIHGGDVWWLYPDERRCTRAFSFEGNILSGGAGLAGTY